MDQIGSLEVYTFFPISRNNIESSMDQGAAVGLRVDPIGNIANM